MAPETKLTPLMEQYFKIKKDYPDTLLFFQVGDFYELFFDDAKVASQYLAITLTKRGKCQGQDIPICGVPLSSAKHYLTKLVTGGFKVAMCDQISKPVPGEIVKREVSRVYTPGTLIEDGMLDQAHSSYLCAVWQNEKEYSLLFIELLTAKVYATLIEKDAVKILEAELMRFFPDEILLPNHPTFVELERFFAQKKFTVSPVAPLESHLGNLEEFYPNTNPELSKFWHENLNEGVQQTLQEQAGLQASFGLLTSYLAKYHGGLFKHIDHIEVYQSSDFLHLDAATQKNLEIVTSMQAQRADSLFGVINYTKTNMGARYLKQALLFPLQDLDLITKRLDSIQDLKKSFVGLQKLADFFTMLPDLERMVGRIALDRAGLPDLLGLKKALILLDYVYFEFGQMFSSDLLRLLWQNCLPKPELVSFLENSLNDDNDQDWLVKDGYSPELDQMRQVVLHAQDLVLALEQAEINQTNITNLKIKYTDLHGYFFEVSQAWVKDLPERFILQQSLVGRSRFVTVELQQLEVKINQANQEIDDLEKKVFEQIKQKIVVFIPALRKLSYSLAYLDFLHSLARLAYDHNYVRPEFDLNAKLTIEAGRHPVIEQKCVQRFVPNDASFGDDCLVKIITGPNMGGKSTYLRQVAHNVLLAHVGSFVPAQRCVLPLVDRIFTRIGSGDNLAAGKSTFWIEMEEVATICQQATNKSLIIFDEVGRGTSTYDGMAIAEAIIEYVVQVVKAHCLFATHYLELTHLAQRYSNVKNYFVHSHQQNNQIIFLHKILPGIAEKSFGILVAKMAGVPSIVVENAQTILQRLEVKDQTKPHLGTKISLEPAAEKSALNLWQKELLQEINSVCLDEVSFKQAHGLLEAWQQRLKKNGDGKASSSRQPEI